MTENTTSAVKKQGSMKYVVILALSAGMAGLLYGYDTVSISGAIEFLRQAYNLSAGLQGLVISSIMIGVITYISVLERRKEIGILRAIGASKRNISEVFNAETFIIGLCSGCMGVGLSLILLIPGNMLIHSIADSASVTAALPLQAALVLIALSVVLTLLGGLIPSKKASKSDPVTALRTE